MCRTVRWAGTARPTHGAAAGPGRPASWLGQHITIRAWAAAVRQRLAGDTPPGCASPGAPSHGRFGGLRRVGGDSRRQLLEEWRAGVGPGESGSRTFDAAASGHHQQRRVRPSPLMTDHQLAGWAFSVLAAPIPSAWTGTGDRFLLGHSVSRVHLRRARTAGSRRRFVPAGGGGALVTCANLNTMAVLLHGRRSRPSLT